MYNLDPRYRLRRLCRDDAETFKALRLGGLRDAPSSFRFAAADDFVQDHSALVRRLVHAFVVGAFHGPLLAGSAGIEQIPGRKLNHKWLLWGMYVVPDHRGCGLGAALIEMLLNHARAEGARSVQLTVAANNPSAVNLYRAWGFVEYGCEPDSFAIDGGYESELLMRRQLS